MKLRFTLAIRSPSALQNTHGLSAQCSDRKRARLISAARASAFSGVRDIPTPLPPGVVDRRGEQPHFAVDRPRSNTTGPAPFYIGTHVCGLQTGKLSTTKHGVQPLCAVSIALRGSLVAFCRTQIGKHHLVERATRLRSPLLPLFVFRSPYSRTRETLTLPLWQMAGNHTRQPYLFLPEFDERHHHAWRVAHLHDEVHVKNSRCRPSAQILWVRISYP